MTVKREEKEYGKLSTAQFRELIQVLPDLFAMLRDMNDRLASTPAAKFASVMPGDYGLYSYVYEMPFIQHLSFVVVGLNRQDEVKAMAASPDP